MKRSSFGRRRSPTRRGWISRQLPARRSRSSGRGCLQGGVGRRAGGPLGEEVACNEERSLKKEVVCEKGYVLKE